MLKLKLHKCISKHPESALSVLTDNPFAQVGGRRPKGYDGPFLLKSGGRTYKFFLSSDLPQDHEKLICGEITERANSKVEAPTEKTLTNSNTRSDIHGSRHDTSEEGKYEWELAEKYFYGDGKIEDLRKAADLYHKAFDKGYVKAASALAYLYEIGVGVELDEIKANYFLQIAAEHGDPIAQCDLAYSYRDGFGLSVNLAKAIEWFEQAAQQDYPEAMVELSLIYGAENSQFYNSERAMSLLFRAADLGDPTACELLADIEVTDHVTNTTASTKSPLCEGILLETIPSGKTNQDAVKLLRQSYPECLKKAEELLVATKKKNAGGGLFASTGTRIKRAAELSYQLEQKLRQSGFDTLPANLQLAGKTNGNLSPTETLFLFMNLVAQAYPNWRPEYLELNRFFLQLY